MFTRNQLAVLRVLTAAPNREVSLSELGRLLGKAPGVFQRGLNTLEDGGFIVSRRKANLRLLSANTAHPHYAAVATIACTDSPPLPADVYLAYGARAGQSAMAVAEPPGAYTTSALKVLIIAGPNGAGKTTFAREYLPHEAACHVFINADYIAHGLSPFLPERAALKAGRLMLREVNDHLSQRHNIAIESTLSGKRYARLIPRWQRRGYAVKLIFLSLAHVDLAVARVAGRIRQGGHAIPEQTVRQRFHAGRRNFEGIYKPLVDAWAYYDNSGAAPVLIEEDEK